MNKAEIKKYIKSICVASQRAAMAARSLTNNQRVMIIKKVIKKDLLNLKFDEKKKSYWIKKSTLKSKMKNQF